MKPAVTILIILIFISGCDFTSESPDQMLNEVRQNIAKEAEIKNAKILAWENIIDSLYKMEEITPNTAVKFIDSLLVKDTSLDAQKISDLHFIKGDIYYRIDSLEKSVTEFTASGESDNITAPKILAARAGANLKLRHYDKAFVDLYKAATVNYEYYWNLGNAYEVIENKDSAVSCYTRLYNRDTITYKFCLERASQLKNPKTKLLTGLVYRDRNPKRMVLLLKGVE